MRGIAWPIRIQLLIHVILSSKSRWLVILLNKEYVMNRIKFFGILLLKSEYLDEVEWSLLLVLILSGKNPDKRFHSFRSNAKLLEHIWHSSDCFSLLWLIQKLLLRSLMVHIIWTICWQHYGSYLNIELLSFIGPKIDNIPIFWHLIDFLKLKAD